MAAPPKPYDALTLLFECTALGGVEKCAFYFPKGHVLVEWNRKYSNAEGCPTSRWLHYDCISVYVAGEGIASRRDALMAIASQNLSGGVTAQITRVGLARLHPCECNMCQRSRDIQHLPALLGEHPPED